MRIAIIITTYNRPDALLLTLQSVLSQTRLPDEILIADDGSDGSTRAMLDAFRVHCAIPLFHCWQDDEGFRPARARNLAVSQASSDYLIFTDGDMILHRAFIASHAQFAEKGHFLSGKRAMLSEWRTSKVLKRGHGNINPWSPGINLMKRAFHSDRLARWFTGDSHDWYHTLGANLSVWFDDFVAVNGFNEEFVGWGREDSELALRLMRSGIRKRHLRFCAIAFHLSHGKNNKLKYWELTKQNDTLLRQIEAQNTTVCRLGLKSHLQPETHPRHAPVADRG